MENLKNLLFQSFMLFAIFILIHEINKLLKIYNTKAKGVNSSEKLANLPGPYFVMMSDSLEKNFETDFETRLAFEGITQRIRSTEESFGYQPKTFVDSIFFCDSLCCTMSALYKNRKIEINSKFYLSMKTQYKLNTPRHETLHAIDKKLKISMNPKWTKKFNEISKDTILLKKFTEFFMQDGETAELDSMEFFAYYAAGLYSEIWDKSTGDYFKSYDLKSFKEKSYEVDRSFLEPYVEILKNLDEIVQDLKLEKSTFGCIVKLRLKILNEYMKNLEKETKRAKIKHKTLSQTAGFFI